MNNLIYTVESPEAAAAAAEDLKKPDPAVASAAVAAGHGIYQEPDRDPEVPEGVRLEDGAASDPG